MKVVAPILFAVALLNFLAFFAVASRIGGDALNGRIENGHHFLASHGRLTEVSPALYGYSLWHARSLFVTHPLGLLAMGYLALRMKALLRVSS